MDKQNERSQLWLRINAYFSKAYLRFTKKTKWNGLSSGWPTIVMTSSENGLPHTLGKVVIVTGRGGEGTLDLEERQSRQVVCFS